MRRTLLILNLATSLLAVVAPTAALAEEPTGGCKEFGEEVAVGAQVRQPLGVFIRTQAPFNDDVEGLQTTSCEP